MNRHPNPPIQDLIDNAADGVAVLTENGEIGFANDSFRRMFGDSDPEEVAVVLRIQADSAPRSERPAEDAAPLSRWRGPVPESLCGGRVLEAQLSRATDGAPHRHLLAIIRDMTARSNEETKRLRENRLDSSRVLAASAANVFNNLLTGVMGHLMLAQERGGLTQETATDLRIAGDLLKRISAFVLQLTLFGQGVPAVRKPVDLPQIITQLKPSLRALLGRKIHLEIEHQDLLWRPLADRPLIERMLLCLAANAAEAMSGEGCFSIHTRSLLLDREDCSRHSDARPGPWVKMIVSDSGRGMDPDTLARACEPGFSTKPRHLAGVGYGLSVVHGIVKSLSGFMEIHSRPGEGTRIEICLPTVTTDKGDQTQSGLVGSAEGAGAKG